MKYFQTNLKFLREKQSLNQGQIADIIGIERSNWSNYERGVSFPNLNLFYKIVSHFNVNAGDLLDKDLANDVLNSQNQPAVKNKKNVQDNVPNNVLNRYVSASDSIVKEPAVVYGLNRMPAVVTVDTQGNENVVFVPVKARAGYLTGYGDSSFVSKLPAYRLPGLNNGTFRLFEVEGVSMYPTLHSGDTVIGSFVETFTALRDDRVYVVVTKSEGVVVKRILNRIITDGKLILKSDNYKDRDLYPTLVVDPTDVLEIWYVTGFLSRQLRPPAEMYTRMVDVEGRLTLLEDKLKEKPKK